MQVKIGEKIKELRKVTGRKQEDLATATSHLKVGGKWRLSGHGDDPIDS